MDPTPQKRPGHDASVASNQLHSATIASLVTIHCDGAVPFAPSRSSEPRSCMARVGRSRATRRPSAPLKSKNDSYSSRPALSMREHELSRSNRLKFGASLPPDGASFSQRRDALKAGRSIR